MAVDYCTREGAEKLRKRIIAQRKRAGVPVGNLHVTLVARDPNKGYAVWGLRDRPVAGVVEPAKVTLKQRKERSWYAKARAICARVLLDHPNVPLDVVLEGAGRRTVEVSAARRACIRAVYAEAIAGRTEIALFFQVDQSSISLAINHGRRKDRDSLQVAA